LLKRERPDVVHLHEPNLFLTTPLAFYAKYILKKPVITHCYSDPFDWYGGGILFRLAMSLYGWIYDWKLRLSDHIIVISEAYLNTSRYLPKYRNKVTVLPMCLAPVFRVLPILEVNEFRRDLVGPDRKMVLYVGRVDHRKGIDFLIRAMQSIDAKCVIVGKGEKGAEFALRALTESLNLGNKVIFAGSCDQEELNKYYNACDVLVLPTSDETAETFGAVLLEAWAVAKPVISADNPAPAALIREADAGLLVKREDAMALCGAINRLLTDNGLCMALGQRGYSYVQRRFSFGEVSRRLIELYQRLSKCDERRYT
jgi:glycosyltransferase involved in cell wall biosynthesis